MVVNGGEWWQAVAGGAGGDAATRHWDAVCKVALTFAINCFQGCQGVIHVKVSPVPLGFTMTDQATATKPHRHDNASIR
ncbi:unnamed protein product, partial [Iphiclides podalirius]